MRGPDVLLPLGLEMLLLLFGPIRLLPPEPGTLTLLGPSTMVSPSPGTMLLVVTPPINGATTVFRFRAAFDLRGASFESLLVAASVTSGRAVYIKSDAITMAPKTKFIVVPMISSGP